jgi:hypothetical protein
MDWKRDALLTLKIQKSALGVGRRLLTDSVEKVRKPPAAGTSHRALENLFYIPLTPLNAMA